MGPHPARWEFLRPELHTTPQSSCEFSLTSTLFNFLSSTNKSYFLQNFLFHFWKSTICERERVGTQGPEITAPSTAKPKLLYCRARAILFPTLPFGLNSLFQYLVPERAREHYYCLVSKSPACGSQPPCEDILTVISRPPPFLSVGFFVVCFLL